MVWGHKGKPLSEETRRKMSAAHKARGTLVPGTRLWTPEEDELVRTLPRGEAARRTDTTLQAVTKYSRPSMPSCWRDYTTAVKDGIGRTHTSSGGSRT
jgi:hypothetical protein